MKNYINLNIRELYSNCCDDKELFLNNMLFIRDNYNNRIHNLTSYTPYSIYHFMHNLKGSYDDNMKFNVRLSNDDLLPGICSLLNIDCSNMDEDEIISLINSKIEILKKIKDKSLEKKFPVLYNIFQEGLGMYNKWYSIDFIDSNNPEEKDIYDRLNKIRKEYFSYGFRYSYAKFCEVQADYIERLIKHKEDIYKYCNDKSYVNDIYFKGLNKDKFELYIFYKYLEKIDNCSDDNLRIELLNLLSNRIANIISINDDIIIFDNIDKSTLLAKYTILNRKYNIPKRVTVDGAILPSSEDHGRVGTNKRTYRPLSDEEREELIRLNKKKKDFYNNSGYLTVITEKEDLTGNSAFVYPNGHILEDYIANEESDASLKKNKKNAVYHVDIYGFLDLLDMGKLEVKRDSRCHGTYNHYGDWVSKLQRIVDLDGSSEIFEDTKSFVKRLDKMKKSN